MTSGKKNSPGLHRQKNRRGYSLIELLIASSLLIIAIIGTGQMVLLSWRFKMRSDASAAAADLASSRVEALRPLLVKGTGAADGSAEVLAPGQSKLAYDLTWTAVVHSEGLTALEMHCIPRSLSQKGTRLMVYISAPLGF
jgi:Tfp pilus assembly protein PilV